MPLMRARPPKAATMTLGPPSLKRLEDRQHGFATCKMVTSITMNGKLLGHECIPFLRARSLANENSLCSRGLFTFYKKEDEFITLQVEWDLVTRAESNDDGCLGCSFERALQPLSQGIRLPSLQHGCGGSQKPRTRSLPFRLSSGKPQRRRAAPIAAIAARVATPPATQTQGDCSR